MREASTIRTLAGAFGRIKAATGNEKKDVVREYKDNDTVIRGLDFLLNPYITFGMNDKKLRKRVSTDKTVTFPEFFSLLTYLKNCPSASDKTIANVQAFINECPEDLRYFVYGFISKSIRLGMTAKSVNDALGAEVIPIFECMLAERYFDHSERVVGKGFAITEKFDGIRCIALLDDNGVSLYSRQGQPIDGLVDVERDLLALTQSTLYRAWRGLALDGELLVSARDSIPSVEQYKATTRIVRASGVKPGVTYHVFDIMSAEQFRRRACNIPYHRRRFELDALKLSSPHVVAAPLLYRGDDVSQIETLLRREIESGHEGVMVNLLGAPYEFKRTTSLLKVKLMRDVDLNIIDAVEGEGKYKGTLGALVVDYKGSPLGVGSGFTDADRAWFWAHKADVVGRVITVQYFEETHSASGELSLRFPVFKELREEGKEVSYS